jgi:hypothetical protein
MFAYLAKCFLILLGLWFARWTHMIPWSDMINIAVTVVVPMLIAAGAWRASKRQSAHIEEESAQAALSAVERHLNRRHQS